MRRVGLIDITVGNVGRALAHRNVPPRDAARRTTSLRNPRAAGDNPGGSRAFSADGPPQAPAAPRRSCEAKYMRADELAASRRAVIERRYRPER